MENIEHCNSRNSVLLKYSCKGRQALFNVVMGLKSAIVKGDDTELDLMMLNFTGHIN